MNNALAKPSPDENHTSDGRCKCPTRCQSDEALAWVLWLAYAGLPEDLPITWAGESHRSMWLAAGRTARERIASEPRALDGSDVTSEEVLRDAIERATKAEAALARVTGLYAALREDVEEVNEDGLIYVPGALIRRDNVRAAKEVQTKALTPERLAGIRDRDARVGWVLSKPVAYEAAEDDRTALLAHVDHLTAKDARLREGVAALHGAVQEFEPCPDGPWGCGELTCTESVHAGERYHDDQPTGRVCLTCRYEDGEPHDWPCPTAALLNPPTEGETNADT